MVGSFELIMRELDELEDSTCGILHRHDMDIVSDSSDAIPQIRNASDEPQSSAPEVASMPTESQAGSSLLTELKTQVEEACQRNTKDNVDNVFNQYATGDGADRGIRLPEFKEALCAVRPEFHYLSEEETKQRFVDSDVEDNHALSEAEFVYALEKAFPLQQALSRLPLHRMVESALPGFYTRNPDDHVNIFSSLSDSDIGCMVRAMVSALEKMLRDAAHDLKGAIALQQSGSGSDNSGGKFSITLSGGSVDDFHAGLSGRVGGAWKIRNRFYFQELLHVRHAHFNRPQWSLVMYKAALTSYDFLMCHRARPSLRKGCGIGAL